MDRRHRCGEDVFRAAAELRTQMCAMETLDTRDEGETLGFLNKRRTHPGCACPIHKTVNTHFWLAEQHRAPPHLLRRHPEIVERRKRSVHHGVNNQPLLHPVRAAALARLELVAGRHEVLLAARCGRLRRGTGADPARQSRALRY